MANRRLRPSLKRRRREFDFGERRVIAEGMTEHPWSDLYRTAMVATWPQFLLALAAIFVALNLIFAWFFGLGGDSIANARRGSFADLFFFSVETLSTTGYGDMHPQTTWGHLVATVEIFVSLIATAGITGLIFARFSRPRARLIFARHPVVLTHNGVETLVVRVVNARNSYITEATAKMWMLAPSVSAEGREYRGFRPLRLLRGENPAFALSWTLFHPIDAGSPLYSKSREDMISDKIRFVLGITGLDESASQMVYSRQVYAADDIRWGHEFVDMFHSDEQDRSHVDFSKINDTRKIST